MIFHVGQQYEVVNTNSWVEVGEIITCIHKEGAFRVGWEQTTRFKLGEHMLNGYDPFNKTYNLFLFASDVRAIPLTIEIGEADMENDVIEDIVGRVKDKERITAKEWAILCELSLEPGDYTQPEDDFGYYYHEDNLRFCELSDMWFVDESEFCEYRDRNGELKEAHRDALENGRFFWCERSEMWYSNWAYTGVYVRDMGETWCLEEHEDELTYCEEDDNYYFDEDEMPKPDRIPSYHSQSRNWQIPDGITLGVELEVYIEDAEDAYTNRNSEIIGERDGSLDDEHGVEFIGPPMNYERYFKMDNPWRRTLGAIKDAGVDDVQDAGYGMHISVGRAPISHETQARFVLFINCCQEFSEFIAQRPQNRWAEYDKKDPFHVTNMMAHTGDCWGGKYSATHIDRHRIEVRIFRSVTDPKLFQKNVDYVMSALEYADTNLFVEDMMSVSNYLVWLSKQDKYQALKDFIGKDGDKFAQDDVRRKELQQLGFIIQDTNQPPTI